MKAKTVVLIFFFVSCALWQGCDSRQKTTGGAEYAELNPAGDFTLTDQDGRAFRLKDHRGQILLLFFGYLTCPDVCPATLSKLARVYSLLGAARRPKVLTVFISVDGERDTPGKLKEYLEYFNINAIGLTGTKAQVDQVVHAYKAFYEKVETGTAVGYLINHSDYLYLIDARGKTSHLFHPEDKAEDMAGVIRRTGI
jgi:protein SCO1/2